MTAALPPPTQIFGPATELATLWLEELRRRSGTVTLDWSHATRITTRLLEHMAVRLHGGTTAEMPLDDLVTGGGAPGVDDIVVLRSLLRRRAVERLDAAAGMVILGIANDVVDQLLATVVQAKVDALESAAFLDPLTGVRNRRALERDLDTELARAFRHGRPLSVAAIDVDGLKALNDTQGHAAGDDALRRLAFALNETLRVGDLVYRVGGDEFVVLLPETAPEDVQPLLVRTMGVAPPFSFGVASAPHDATTGDALLTFADAQLIENRRRIRLTEPVGAEAGSEEQIAAGWDVVAPPAREDLPAPGADARLSPERSPSHACGERLRIDGILAVASERALTVEVTLRRGDHVLSGRATGSSASAAANRIIASAALDAASSVDPELTSTYIEGVSLLRVGESDIAVVHVVVVGTVEETSTGAAQIRHRGVGDAIARAVLDALNRRLCMRLTTASVTTATGQG